MEGLIPYIIDAIRDRKQKPRHRTLSRSDSSNSSYHLLLGSDSFSGSSHRKGRSDFQQPVSELLEQRYAVASARARGHVSAAPNANAAITASHSAANNIRKRYLQTSSG